MALVEVPLIAAIVWLIKAYHERVIGFSPPSEEQILSSDRRCGWKYVATKFNAQLNVASYILLVTGICLCRMDGANWILSSFIVIIAAGLFGLKLSWRTPAN